jgi:hypothetical protein
LATSKNEKLQFEVWINNGGSFKLERTYDPPSEAILVGQSIFADFGKINFQIK